MKNLIFGLLSFLSFQLNAQNSSTVDSLSVTTIDGIVNIGFKTLSELNGDIRNFEKLGEIYLPTAKFTVVYHESDSIPLKYESLSAEQFFEYMKEASEYYEKGFIQYELGKVVNEYNGIANVFQSFYAKDSENQEVKGMTSYQLIYFDDRWWISDVLWTSNSNGIPIPGKYIKQ